MTYTALEISAESGRPVELYVFTILGTAFRYTSAASSVIIGGDSYESVAITREGVSSGLRTRDDLFKVNAIGSHPVAQRYVNIPPGGKVKLQVFRYHRDDLPTPTVVTIFVGFVESVRFTNNGLNATFNARSAVLALNRPMPRMAYHGQCNYVLYSAGCGVDKTLSTNRLQNTAVTSAARNVLTVPAAATFPDGWFTSGYCELTDGSDRRDILSHTGDQLGLMFPFGETPLAITAYAGCAHTAPICHSKHNNLLKYGGFPVVPTVNPYQTGL